MYDNNEGCDKPRSDILEGRNPVYEALRSGRQIDKLLVAKGAAKGPLTRILNLASEKRIPVRETQRQKLDSMSQTGAHQGIIALVAAAQYATVQEILDVAAARDEAPLIVVCDSLNDAHNLGSIIRCAECCGVHGVIIPKNRSVSLSAVTAKASAGAVEYVKVARVTNLTQTLQTLKKAGLWVCGTDAEATQPLYQADLTGPLAIVIGSEGAGISRLVRESCDFLVHIPMSGKLNSLNASVAAGILLYEATRQRMTG